MLSTFDFEFEDSDENVQEEKVEEVVVTEDGTGSSSNVAPALSTLTFEFEDSDTSDATSTETEAILEEEYVEPTLQNALEEEIKKEKYTPISTQDFEFDDGDTGAVSTGLSYQEPSINLYNAEFFELDKTQNSISVYLTARDGKSGARQEGESKEEYAERYFTHMRWLESNLYKTGKGISWLGNADTNAKGNFAFLYTAYKQMPGAFSPGGGDAFSAVQDYIYASVLDPVNVVTLGGAMGLKVVGGRMAGQVLLRTALKNTIPRIALAGGADTLMGAVQEGAIQTVEQRAKGTYEGEEIQMREEKDWRLITTMGLLNGSLGTIINVASLRSGARNTDYAASLRAELDEMRLDLDGNSATSTMSAQAGAAPTVDGVGRGGTIYDRARARGLMDENIESSSISGGIIKHKVTEDIIKIAGALVRQIPDLRQKDNERLSDVFMDLVSTVLQPKELDKLSPHLTDVTMDVAGEAVPLEQMVKNTVDALQVTLKKEGISQEDFAQMMRLSADEGGTILTALSHEATKINKLTKLTKDELEMLDPAYAEDLVTYGFFKNLGYTLMSWDRTRRAILTSMPITTIRNIGGASGYVSMETASRILVESTLGVGRAVRATVEGRSSVQGTKDGLKDVVRNSFGLLGKMFTYGDNRALSELILKDHAKLSHALLRTTNEAGEHELNKIVRGVNALNIAQDQYIRSGVFVDSVSRQLRLHGMDAKKILSQGKQIPAPIVKQAVDDALTATFSSPAKIALAKDLLGAVEKLPFLATAEFPFLRFMMNAIHFQYKYSFLNVLSGGDKVIRLKGLLDEGGIELQYNAAKLKSPNSNKTKRLKKLMDGGVTGSASTGAQTRLKQSAADEFGRAAVGTAMLVAAIKYRSENQNTSILDMYSEDGEGTNVSALFPLPAYLAMGDLFYKMFAEDAGSMNWREFSQATLGLQKAPFSDAGRFFSEFGNIKDADEVTTERLGEAMGKFVGGLTGQYATPLKFVKQVLTAFDDEESIIRDPNWVEGEGFWERAMNRGVTEVQRNLPIVSQLLPEKYGPTRPNPMRSDFAPAAQLTGLITSVKPTKVESLLEEFGYKKYFIGNTSGNRIVDSVVKKHMSGPLDLFITDLMELPNWENELASDKKSMIQKAITKAINVATLYANQDLNGISVDRGYDLQAKAAWMKMSAKDRSRINERYVLLKKETPSTIPKGASATTTIQQDQMWTMAQQLQRSLP